MKEKDDGWIGLVKENPSYAILLFLLILLAFSLAPFEPSICTGDEQNPCKYVVRYHLIHWLFAFVAKYSGAISALATIAIAVYTVVLARVSNRQADLIQQSIDESAKATRHSETAANAASISAAAAVAVQRPWIKANLWIASSLDEYDRGIRCQFKVNLENTGNSPATNIHVWAAMCCGGNGVPFANAISKIPRPGGEFGFSMFPDDSAKVDVWGTIVTEEINIALANAMATDHIYIGVVVSVSYTFLGGIGETRKIYRLHGPDLLEMVNIKKLPADPKNISLESVPIQDIVI